MLWRYATGARVEQIDVPLSRISPALRLAVIVAEDGSFCRNPGIDLGEIRAALEQSNDNLDRISRRFHHYPADRQKPFPVAGAQFRSQGA